MLKLLSLLICASSVTFAQDSGEQIQKKPTLNTTADSLAGDILKASKNPGGVELILGCDGLGMKTFHPNFENPDAALADIARTESHVTWTKKGSAYTVTIQLAPSQSLTSVRLPALQIRAKTLSQATDSLLNEGPVRERISAMNTSEMTENFGFASINEREMRVIDLPPGTLREDLNVIATAFGSAIWKLDQRECNKSRTFKISWISK